MIVIGYLNFNNIEELELKFFKELDLDEDLENHNQDEDLKNFNYLFSYYKKYNLLKVIKIIDKKIIAFKICNSYRKEYFVFDEILDLKVGNVFDFQEIGKSGTDFRKAEIIKIDKEILNKEFLIKCLEKLSGKYIDKENLELEEIKKEDIEKEIENILEMKKLEKIKEEQDKETKENKISKIQITYEKESILKNPDYSLEVNKNIIIINDDTFIFKKNVNKIFDFNYFYCYNYSFKSIVEKLVVKKESFTHKVNNKKIFNIQFENNSKKNIIKSLTDGRDTNIVKINGVKVRKNKIEFILGRININTTKNEIKLLNKFSGIKNDLLYLKSINVYNYNFNIEVLFFPINEKHFKVKLFGVTRDFDWDYLKKVFCSGLNIYDFLYIKEFLIFCGKFGLSKSDVYLKLQRIDMLNKLQEENK